MRPSLSLRLDFGDHRLGPGKAMLLDGIRRTGSISAAGREMAMSYRRAWLLVEELNRMFGPLVTTKTGGASGGGASLTARGEEVLALYRAAEAAMKEAAAAELARLDELSAGLVGEAAEEPPADSGEDRPA